MPIINTTCCYDDDHKPLLSLNTYVKQKRIKITADYVIDEYLAAKELKGEKREKALAWVKSLSQHMNRFITREA